MDRDTPPSDREEDAERRADGWAAGDADARPSATSAAVKLAPYIPPLPALGAGRWARRLVLACAALGPVAAVGWTVLQPVRFRAQAVLDYGRDPHPAQLTPTAGDSHYEWKRTQDVLLTSRGVLGRAADNLELNASVQSVPSQQSAAARAVAVEELRGRVRVAEVPETALCRVSYEDADPSRAARVANAIVAAYLERAREERVNSAKQTYGWFSAQIDTLKGQLSAAEHELEAYHAVHPMPPIPLEERQRMLVQEIETLSRQLTDARVRRIERAAHLAKISAAVTSEAPFDAHATELDDNEQVKQLRSAYTELRIRERELDTAQEPNSHAALIVATKLIALRAEMRAVLDGVQASARGEYAQAQQVEEQLRLALERANSESKQLQRLQLEYGRLQRERADAEALLHALRDRASASTVETAVEATGPKLVEAAAIPVEPLPRPWLRNLAVAALLSLGMFVVGRRLPGSYESLP